MSEKTSQFKPDSAFLPYRDEQLATIPLQSPAALEGAFRYLLRERFKQSDTWTWERNPTLSKILIEVGDERNVNVSDRKPSIWVSHGQTAYTEVVQGNRDQHQPDILQKRLQHYYTVADADMRIVCVSPRRTESILLGDMVQKFVHFSSKPICGIFKLYNISPVVLNSTQSMEKDENHYVTPIMFRVSYELRWATIPAAAPLNSLKIAIQEKGQEAVFSEIIMESESNL